MNDKSLSQRSYSPEAKEKLRLDRLISSRANLANHHNPQKTFTATAYLELVMKASRVIAQADDLNEALLRLSCLVVANLPSVYCRILLSAEDGQSFIVRAAQATSIGSWWSPRLGESVTLTELPDSKRLRRAEVCLVWPDRDQLARQQLSSFSRHLGLEDDLRLLLLVPLKVRERLVGLLELGDLQCEEDSLLNEDKVQVTVVIATLVAVLVDRMQRLEATQQAVDAMAAAFDLLQAQLFEGRVEKPENIKGLGVGLLVVKASAETNGGPVHIGRTNDPGTG